MQLPGWALLGLAQRLPSSGAQPGLAGSQGAPARSTPGPGSPSATFVWEPPGQREGAQQRSACVQTLPAFREQRGRGRRGDEASPCPANKTGIQGSERAAAPGRPGLPGWGVGGTGLVGHGSAHQAGGDDGIAAHTAPWWNTGGSGHGRGHEGCSHSLTWPHTSRCIPMSPATGRSQGSARGAAGLRSRRREAPGAAPGAPEAPGFVCSGAPPVPGAPRSRPAGPRPLPAGCARAAGAAPRPAGTRTEHGASCSGLQSQASDRSPTPPPDGNAQHENRPPPSSYTVLHQRLCENAETKRAPNPECGIEGSSKWQS